MMVKIGIIGGSGLDDPKLLENYEEKEINTPYGKPSSKITCGKISEIEVCILSRHGKNHDVPPSAVNYKANIYALKTLGCTHILATTAVGSLRDEIKPGNLVFPNQFIDFTKNRDFSFFREPGKVVECAFIIEFIDLPGRSILEKQGRKVFSIIRSKESG
jgi:5'-methylthioadenosine phosphorylase